MMMFVDRFRLPLLSNLLVNIAVHGPDTLVEPSNTYCPLTVPFTALRVRVDPITLMLVKCGAVGSLAATATPATNRSRKNCGIFILKRVMVGSMASVSQPVMVRFIFMFLVLRFLCQWF